MLLSYWILCLLHTLLISIHLICPCRLSNSLAESGKERDDLQTRLTASRGAEQSLRSKIQALQPLIAASKDAVEESQRSLEACNAQIHKLERRVQQHVF